METTYSVRLDSSDIYCIFNVLCQCELADIAITLAVKASDPFKLINLQFTFSTSNILNYMALYFTEVSLLGDYNTRYINLYVSNNFMLTLAPEYGNYSWARAIAHWNSSHKCSVESKQ